MILIEPPRSTTAARRDPLNQRELARFAKEAVCAAGAKGAVSVLLTDDTRIRELNRQFRRKDTATDVLSFPAMAWEGQRQTSAGDLAISLETAGRQAAAFGHSLATEVKVLILHGTLHLAGLDHETDTGEMAEREGELRERFGLPSGLIQRASSQPSRRAANAPVRNRRAREGRQA